MPRPASSAARRKAPIAGLVDQVFEPIKPWRRASGPRRRRAAHLPSSQLVERLLAQLLDRAEGGPGLFGLTIKHVERGRSLHVDRGHAVGDHIVEITRDSKPLLRNVAAGFLFSGSSRSAHAARAASNARRLKWAVPRNTAPTTQPVNARKSTKFLVAVVAHNANGNARTVAPTVGHLRRQSPRSAISVPRFCASAGPRYADPAANFPTVFTPIPAITIRE